MQTVAGPALTRPTRLCFIVEEKYENDVMPGVVADALVSWGHEVDILRPQLHADRRVGPAGEGVRRPGPEDRLLGPGPEHPRGRRRGGYRHGQRLPRHPTGPGQGRGREPGPGGRLPFPTTFFASRAGVLAQVPPAEYPLVVKPNNGSSCEQIFRVNGPAELEHLDLDDSGFLLAQPYLPNPGYDVKLYNTGDEVFAAVKRSPLHPGEDVVEELIPVTPELRALATAVGRAFGLDIYGVDVVETSRGWVVLDVNDFPSFGKVPDVAWRLARTVLRLAAPPGGRPPVLRLRHIRPPRCRNGGIRIMKICLLAESATNPVLSSVLDALAERHRVTVADPREMAPALARRSFPEATSRTSTSSSRAAPRPSPLPTARSAPARSWSTGLAPRVPRSTAGPWPPCWTSRGSPRPARGLFRRCR